MTQDRAAPGNSATPTSSANLPFSTTTTPKQPDTDETDLVAFVMGYYNVMPNTSAGWEFIGPNLQTRTRERYDRFWARYSRVDVLGKPSVQGNAVTVRIVLHRWDGQPNVTEDHVLGIATCGDHLCIDSDTLVRSR